MRGPPPKPASRRQRQNKAATAALLPAEGAKRRAPALPRGREWQPATRSWWADIWASPMSLEFIKADKHALLRLAVMVDLFWVRPSANLSAEIRLGQQAFGLTPMDRRRLQWTIEKAETAKRRRPAASVLGVDPRDVLKVVK